MATKTKKAAGSKHPVAMMVCPNGRVEVLDMTYCGFSGTELTLYPKGKKERRYFFTQECCPLGQWFSVQGESIRRVVGRVEERLVSILGSLESLSEDLVI